MVFAVIGVELGLDSAESIDDDIFHAWNEVTLHVDAEFALDVRPAISELLGVKISLPLSKGESVSFFMDSVDLLILNLQTLICQVHILVAAIKRVLRAGGAQVALSVEIHFILGRH